MPGHAGFSLKIKKNNKVKLSVNLKIFAFYGAVRNEWDSKSFFLSFSELFSQSVWKKARRKGKGTWRYGRNGEETTLRQIIFFKKKENYEGGRIYR